MLIRAAEAEPRAVRSGALARAALLLGGFLALTLLLRIGSFPRSVIDLDESFFMLFGRSLLRGQPPYVTFYDNSPLGGFALFALIQAAFGQSVLAIRIATWLAAGLTCYLVYRLAYRVAGARAGAGTLAGAMAGVVYAVATLFNLGLAAHREMFLAPLVTFAMLMVLPAEGRPRPLRLLAAGIALACALQLKYMYIFECAAVALAATLQIALLAEGPRRSTALELARAWALLALPAVVVAGGLAAAFALTGHWAEFAASNFGSPAAYVSNRPYPLTYLARRLAWQFRSNPLVWLGAAVAPLFLLRRGARPQRIAVAAMLGWFALALVGTASTGRYWDHYYLQLVAPGAVLTAAVLAAALGALPANHRAERAVLLLFIVAPLLGSAYPPLLQTASLARLLARGEAPPADGPVLASAYLKPKVPPGEAIFVADYEPLVYYLVDARIPTRYAFPPHLTNPDLGKMGIPQLQEFHRVMDGMPLYVIRQRPPSNDMQNPEVIGELAARLTQGYRLEKEIAAAGTFDGQPVMVEIYRRK